MSVRPNDPSNSSRAAVERTLRKASEILLRLFERRGLRGRSPAPKHVGVFLLDSKAMRSLKRDARMRAPGSIKISSKPVDVLAFPHEQTVPYPEISGRYLGDVYINFEAYGAQFEKILFLLVHGVLHLLGYRHDGKRDTMTMEHMERILWRHLCLLV